MELNILKMVILSPENGALKIPHSLEFSEKE